MSAAEKHPGAPVIELLGVTVRSAAARDDAALREVDWTVRAGEIWLVAGLHGAGKTQLMSLLAGLTQPGEGVYRLFGAEMPGDEREGLEARQKTGCVFEHAGLLHQLSVRDNVSLPLQYHSGISDEDVERRMEWVMEFTGLTDHADTYPRRLSRPRLRRALLARALTLEPELMLLDMPLNGLDPRDSGWWLGTLLQLNRGQVFKGKPPVTLVITVDDLRPWKGLGCNLALLKQGRLLKPGREQEWHGNPEPLIAELLAERLAPAPAETA